MIQPNSVLIEGVSYDIDYSTSIFDKNVVYLGSSTMFGKPNLIFETNDTEKRRIGANPSYIVRWQETVYSEPTDDDD